MAEKKIIRRIKRGTPSPDNIAPEQLVSEVRTESEPAPQSGEETELIVPPTPVSEVRTESEPAPQSGEETELIVPPVPVQEVRAKSEPAPQSGEETELIVPPTPVQEVRTESESALQPTKESAQHLEKMTEADQAPIPENPLPDAEPEKKKKKSSSIWLIIGLLLGFAALDVAIYFYFMNKRGKSENWKPSVVERPSDFDETNDDDFPDEWSGDEEIIPDERPEFQDGKAPEQKPSVTQSPGQSVEPVNPRKEPAASSSQSGSAKPQGSSGQAEPSPSPAKKPEAPAGAAPSAGFLKIFQAAEDGIPTVRTALANAKSRGFLTLEEKSTLDAFCGRADMLNSMAEKTRLSAEQSARLAKINSAAEQARTGIKQYPVRDPNAPSSNK